MDNGDDVSISLWNFFDDDYDDEYDDNDDDHDDEHDHDEDDDDDCDSCDNFDVAAPGRNHFSTVRPASRFFSFTHFHLYLYLTYISHYLTYISHYFTDILHMFQKYFTCMLHIFHITAYYLMIVINC